MFGRKPAPAPTQATVQAYEPTLRDQAANWLAEKAGGGWLARNVVGNALGSTGLPTGRMSAVDFTPLGVLFAAEEAGRKIGAGNRGGGLADLAMAAVPIPAVAKAGKGMIGSGARKAVQAVEKKAAPIVAYHGSPHKFDAFDISKVGTGEGAQAYGHGLYFAENEGVARQYRDALADEHWTVDGQAYDANNPAHRAAESLARFQERGGDKYSLLQDLLAKRRDYEARGTDWAASAAKQTQDEINAIVNGQVGKFESKTLGHMYQVGIHADPNDFLDWDAPLSQQSPQLQRKLMDHPEAHRFQPDWTGAQLYESSKLVPGDHANKVAATDALGNLGVPGIKYLDQGSRGKATGTRNFVVFNPQIVDIMKRYGVAAPVAAAMLASGQYGQEPPKQ